MTRNSRVKGSTVQQVSRRERVLDKLILQLEYGNKRDKDDKIVSLASKDIIRIKKEIATLKTKI